MSTQVSTQLKVSKTFKDGSTRKYAYDIIGGVPISKYMNQKAKEYRVKKRWEDGKVRVSDLSAQSIEEMKALSEVGLSFGKIAILYGVSRYIISAAMERATQ
jgi:hypothetical protein